MRYFLAMVLMAGFSSCSDGKHGAGERATRVSEADTASYPDVAPGREAPAAGRQAVAEAATVD